MLKSDRTVFIVLATVIVILLVAVIFFGFTPAGIDRFTEFYVLNREGSASGYPEQVKVGQQAVVKLGIINNEGKPTTYKIQITANGAIINNIETGMIANGQKWEHDADFAFGSAGDNQTVAFYLYMNNEDIPHIKDPLLLKINVIE